LSVSGILQQNEILRADSKKFPQVKICRRSRASDVDGLPAVCISLYLRLLMMVVVAVAAANSAVQLGSKKPRFGGFIENLTLKVQMLAYFYCLCNLIPILICEIYVAVFLLVRQYIDGPIQSVFWHYVGAH